MCASLEFKLRQSLAHMGHEQLKWESCERELKTCFDTLSITIIWDNPFLSSSRTHSPDGFKIFQIAQLKLTIFPFSPVRSPSGTNGAHARRSGFEETIAKVIPASPLRTLRTYSHIWWKLHLTKMPFPVFSLRHFPVQFESSAKDKGSTHNGSVPGP